MGEMKTTLTATFIQISIRALVVAVLVPRIGLNGAAWACAVGWSAMLCYTFARYRRVRDKRIGRNRERDKKRRDGLNRSGFCLCRIYFLIHQR